MNQKKLRYSRPMSKRERSTQRRLLAEQAESARRYQEHVAAHLESIRQRALNVQNSEEVRALCREVWSKRHSCAVAVSLTHRILEERRARGELLQP